MRKAAELTMTSSDHLQTSDAPLARTNMRIACLPTFKVLPQEWLLVVPVSYSLRS
jgi:hypothetical protein